VVNLITGNTITNEVGTKADAFAPMIKMFAPIATTEDIIEFAA
jgi:hypothetical protein